MEEYSSPDASTDPVFMARWTENIINMPSRVDFPESPAVGDITHVGDLWFYWDGSSWTKWIGSDN